MKYNRIKTDLLKMARCIHACKEKSEEEMYQNVCLEFSRELKNIQKSIEDSYNVKMCGCCQFEQ